MDIEGYDFVKVLPEAETGAMLILAQCTGSSFQVITGNDALWHYMITGQVLEGNENGRTTTGTEETTD